MAKPIVAIVGRPNVGKSLLFNKLVGQRLSIVEDTPGVTRDRIYGEADWNGRHFTLVDTGGIEPNTDNQILSFMREQAQIAIDNATVIIFLCDIKTGLTASDQEVANMLLRSGKPVVLGVNKMDSTGALNPDIYEFYNLGLGDPIPVSAVHGHGTGDLLDACVRYFPEPSEEEEDSEYIRQLMREAYLANPASALDFPDAQITMYPETGQRRIVEVELTYHQSRQTLESRRNSLLREADRRLLQVDQLEGDRAVAQLIQLVLEACVYQEGSGSTAYDALLEGAADSQGMALALALLCQRIEISCQVVDGQMNGVSHQWNVVQTSAGYRHVDLSQPGTAMLRTDAEMLAAGYTWDGERVPVCTADPEE